VSTNDETLSLIAALVAGDRWLDADATAAHLGMFTRGKVNRRGFLERVACLPSFPVPLVIGQEKKWRKSQVDEWALEQQRAKRSA
jgi:hypothetical protein